MTYSLCLMYSMCSGKNSFLSFHHLLRNAKLLILRMYQVSKFFFKIFCSINTERMLQIKYNHSTIFNETITLGNNQLLLKFLIERLLGSTVEILKVTSDLAVANGRKLP